MSEIVIKEETKERYSKAMSRLDQLTEQDIDRVTEELEQELAQIGTSKLSPNISLEIYLYEYWEREQGEYITAYKLHELYKRKAQLQYGIGAYQQAEETIEQARKWNPVDMELLFLLAECYRGEQNWTKLHQTEGILFPYCYTKADLARYYRILGSYYLEIYEPALAKMLYLYSQFFQETEVAEHEIQFLEEVMKEHRRDYTLQELQEAMQEKEIPVQPARETLAILYYAAQNETEEELAKQYYFSLYELTGDEEIRTLLER